MANEERIELRKDEITLLTVTTGDLIPELSKNPELLHVRQIAYQYWDQASQKEFQVHIIVTRDVSEFLEPFEIVHMSGYKKK